MAYLSEITHDLGELERLVDDILTSARLAVADANRGVSGPPLRWARVEIAELVEGVANRFRARHPERSLRLESDTLLEAMDLDAMSCCASTPFRNPARTGRAAGADSKWQSRTAGPV